MVADHRVRVVELTDADGSEFFILCSCPFEPTHTGLHSQPDTQPLAE